MGENGEYGCCPEGERCEGDGGSVFIDEKSGGGDDDGGSGEGGESSGVFDDGNTSRSEGTRVGLNGEMNVLLVMMVGMVMTGIVL